MTDTSQHDALAIGVDIGGTKVAAGLVNSRGELLSRTEVPMFATGTAAEAMACVDQAIRAILCAENSSQVRAIGIASPGPLELPAGIVIDTPNLPCWHNFPLGDTVRQTYHLPTVVDNDANAAGLAEAVWGAGASYDSVFFATIGTGIGTAFVQAKQLYYGLTAVAPEGGHMTIDFHAPRLCECGKRGCLEGLASGPSIARRARERLLSANGSFNRQLWGDPALITTRLVANAYHAGDPLATDLLRETADMFAVWFGNIIDLLEPAAIVVGGGVAHLVSEWFPYIREQLPTCSIIPNSANTPILLARYATDAGIIGAAALSLGR